MILNKLSLLNFKNYREISLEFSDTINCLAGNNGSGKTNILDAIHYLALCKSYFNATDSQHVKQGEQLFVIQGDFLINNMEEKIFCGLKLNQKKIFKRNQKEYDKLSDHIGLLPVVMIAPVDQEIITGGSEERRKFVDSIISQTDRDYLISLIHYNRILSHRNALLKQMAVQQITDHASLDIWDEQMIPLGEKIFQKRKIFSGQFIIILEEIYRRLSRGKEEIELIYESHLHEKDFSTLLKNSFRKDVAIQYTSSGIHKDDLLFSINGMSAKKFASQGQQKTFAVALKLAQYEMLRNAKNTKPILMLDDVFDKLDESRVSGLMELVAEDRFGQLFITDTHPDRVAKIFNRINIPVKKFLIDNGIVLQEEKNEV
jgi:DNA replication and repair protein RecF